jgi:hypothetical protein
MKREDPLHSAHGKPHNVVISIPIPPLNSSLTSGDPCAPWALRNDPSRIAPTITIYAQWPIVATSCFVVFLADQVMHTETAPLMILMREPPPGTAFLHSTPLVPDCWNVILDSPGELPQRFTWGFSSPFVDPSRFVILQKVYDESRVLFSAEYRFVYPPGSTARTAVHLYAYHTTLNDAAALSFSLY